MKNLQPFEEFLNEGKSTNLSLIQLRKGDSKPMLEFYKKKINGVETVTVSTDKFFNDDTDFVSLFNNDADVKKFLIILQENFEKSWLETIKKFK